MNHAGAQEPVSPAAKVPPAFREPPLRIMRFEVPHMTDRRQTCAGVVFTRPLRAEMRGDIPVPAMDETAAVTHILLTVTVSA